MEQYVVSRELAEKLKEADFPQNTQWFWRFSKPAGLSKIYYCEDMRYDNERFKGPMHQRFREDNEFFAAPMTDELLEQLPTTIVLPNSKGRAYLEAQWSDYRTCRYDYRDGYGSVLDDLVDFPDDPHNWYKKNADALAYLWIWCKENGYLDGGQGGQESE